MGGIIKDKETVGIPTAEEQKPKRFQLSKLHELPLLDRVLLVMGMVNLYITLGILVLLMIYVYY